MIASLRGSILFLALSVSRVDAFAGFDQRRRTGVHNRRRESSLTSLSLFGKLFEEEGPLGKGITVGKVQVALMSNDRSANSITGILEKKASATGSSPSSAQLARLANEVCLALLRKSDDWTAACSDSKWFSGKDGGKAESQFNDWANREAFKFEKVRVVLAICLDDSRRQNP